MTKGMGRRDQKHFINICQKHKIRKKIFELQETQMVKKIFQLENWWQRGDKK